MTAIAMLGHTTSENDVAWRFCHASVMAERVIPPWRATLARNHPNSSIASPGSAVFFPAGRGCWSFNPSAENVSFQSRCMKSFGGKARE